MVPGAILKFIRTVAVVTASLLLQNIVIAKKARSPNATPRLITQSPYIENTA